MTDRDLTIRIGRDELIVRQRWEAASIANDFLIAVWFVIGSVLFFWESTTFAATWFFLIGSIQFLIRPAIRLSRRFHLQRIRGGQVQADSADDY
ncbi:YrhK family protein [Williamsia serinedens]|uniref:YrhK-like protein n=1 Tax=Williamsia serinedens TaxID=391736 RepID=A0ABT1H036_9NOCA|nr:YrhK family protein [Williamsia serinedens]MCP2159985.1 YrhK-like protein [Williamsia serinedens]